MRRLTDATNGALPARFGSLAPTRDALLASLRPRSRALLRALARVANREQMTLSVRASSTGSTAPADGPGTRHLRRLAARDPRASGAVRRLLEQLRPLVRGEQVEPAGDDQGAGRIHHLVERGTAVRYRAQVRKAARAQPELRVSCSGPWAPYSFTAEGS